MPDLNRELTFASFLFPKATEGPGLLGQAELAEQLGYELIAVPDHLDWPHYIDSWTLLSAICARTTSIELLSCVSSLALREPPATLAKAAWSLDVLVPGRFHLGLGTGVIPGIESIGGPLWSPRESLERITEAIRVIKLMWSGEEATFDGAHYQLAAAKPLAAPSPSLDIWVGGIKPGMRRLIAQSADGWIPGMFSIDPEQITEETLHLDDELHTAGRPLTAVRRVYNTIAKKIQPKSEGFLVGPPEQWVDELTPMVLDLGFDVILYGDREATVEGLHTFAEEVVPELTKRVAAARRSVTAGASS
ncbi:MAG TPA: LLM class flavin-dependent oxidoreductase [Gaiellaceae bacterium]|nr:LLM class flavin-dependent oxidoreductase [Gaiellaceae bacterium]